MVAAIVVIGTFRGQGYETPNQLQQVKDCVVGDTASIAPERYLKIQNKRSGATFERSDVRSEDVAFVRVGAAFGELYGESVAVQAGHH